MDDATKFSADLRLILEPYMMEAGIELELMHVDTKLVIQGLMWYFIINKKKLELNDIAKDSDGCKLNDLCCFWTACRSLPVRGDNMSVTFDVNEDNKMPKAESCFLKLILPVSHNTYESFRSSMNAAIAFGSKGFSFV
mgnify:CR=1 FL=1